MSEINYLSPKIQKSEEIIQEAIKKHKKIGLAFSGGSDSAVILSLTLPFKWDIPVIFVDTNYEFPETYEYVDKLRKEWNLNFYTAKQSPAIKEKFIEKYGADTEDFYFNCCLYHKITPLMEAVEDLDLEALIVGIRAVEHPERAKETYMAYKENLKPPHWRIHPILDWTRGDVVDYMTLYNVPVNPIYSKGYTSLGCTYCTKPNLDPNAHERAGRARKRELIKKKMKEEGYN